MPVRSIAAMLFSNVIVIGSNRATALDEEIEDAYLYLIGHEKLDKFRSYCRCCISSSSSGLFSSGVTHANLTVRDCKMLDLRHNKSITVQQKRKILYDLRTTPCFMVIADTDQCFLGPTVCLTSECSSRSRKCKI